MDCSSINFAEVLRLAAQRCNVPAQSTIDSMELNSKITQAKAECGLNAPRRDFKGSKTPDLSSRQVKMRNLEPVALRMGRIQKNSRNRRSISDPNIPRSFFEVKKLWDEKVQSANRTETSAWKKNSIKKPALKPKPPSFKDKQAPNIESIKNQLPCLKDSNSPANCKLTVLKPAWSGSKTPQHTHRYIKKVDKVEKEAKEVETILQRTVYDTAKLFGPTPIVRHNALKNRDRSDSSPVDPKLTDSSPGNKAPSAPQSPKISPPAQKPRSNTTSSSENKFAHKERSSFLLRSQRNSSKQTADDKKSKSADEDLKTKDSMYSAADEKNTRAVLQRKGSSAKERRRQSFQRKRVDSSSPTNNKELRNSNEIPKSFLYSEATIKRRNNTLPSSDGNNSRASTASTSSVSSSAYGDVAMQRLSGPEEMLQRRLERISRDETSPVRLRPNVLGIKNRSRAQTLENNITATDDKVEKRASSLASTPVTTESSSISNELRPDSMSSTVSSEFNPSTGQDKTNDETLKRNQSMTSRSSSGEFRVAEVVKYGSDATPTASPKLENEQTSREKKLFNIVKELLETEETYVKVLKLIDGVFHEQVKEAVSKNKIMPENVVQGIFGQISAIHQFHASYLVGELRKRIENWQSNPMIGDVMERAAHFMKMYSLYVQQFQSAINFVTKWRAKSTAFNAIMTSIEQTPECMGLKLEAHMLTPIQRVPRYQLLLDDYLKRLPEDSPDYLATTKAVEQIKVAASHSNETIQKNEKFTKLIKIFEQMTDINFNIDDVSRELFKEGKIIKISARSGEKHDRYLYLFNDLLVCCARIKNTIGLANKLYRCTATISLEGMQVSSDVHNITTPNAPPQKCTFCVSGLQKTMEFLTSTEDEKENWVNAINQAVVSFEERRKTFNKSGSFHKTMSPANTLRLPNVPPHSPPHSDSPASPALRSGGVFPFNAELVSESELGVRAPRWIKDHEVSMCMGCSKNFSKITRRRHHCRSCGRVICGECSEHKISLQYEPTKPQRVCFKCYEILVGRDKLDADKKGVLEVQADEVTGNSLLADYILYCEGEKKKNFSKMWCVLSPDLVIYIFAAHQDIKAHSTIPLPGYIVKEVHINEHKFTFKLSQAKKVMYFSLKEKVQMKRWMFAISQASKGFDLTREAVLNLGRKPSTEANIVITPTSPLPPVPKKAENQSKNDNSISDPTSFSPIRPISTSSEEGHI